MARIGLLAGVWLLVGLFGGTAIWIGERIAGGAAPWSGAIAPAIAAALLWIPITLAAMALAHRFPLRAGAGSGALPVHGAAALAVHGAAALAVSFVLNAAFVGVAGVLSGGDLDLFAWSSATGAVGFRFLHINALVYAVVIGLVHADRVGIAPAMRADPRESGTPGAGFAHRAGPPRHATRLKAGTAGRVTLIDTDDIRWIEADGDYARVYVEGADHLVSERMKRLERELDPLRFVRIHRSRIVNVERVRTLRHLSHGDYEVTLDDDTPLRVSRGRRRRLLEAVERAQGRG